MKIPKSVISILTFVVIVIGGVMFLNFKPKEKKMDAKTNHKIEIIEFTDPACTWCWGSEPILRKLQYRYENQIKISFVMGGLVKDAHTFMDASNTIGGDLSTFNEQVGTHWLEASQRHGMPVLAEGFKLFDEENPSTFPMNIAYKSAEFQSEELANKFLRRIREATAAEAKQANTMEVLIELAQESGLDIAQFITDMENGKADAAFKSDQALTRKYQASGFPSFLIRSENGKEIMLRGYQTYANFQSAMKHLSGDDLAERDVDFSEANILNFVTVFEKVTTVEIKEAFNLSNFEIEEVLTKLVNDKSLTKTPVGNGFYYQMKGGAMCDDKGVCNF